MVKSYVVFSKTYVQRHDPQSAYTAIPHIITLYLFIYYIKKLEPGIGES